MCTGCSRSTSWLPALMNSADRFPNHVIALEALCSPGFGDPRSDRSVITTGLPCTILSSAQPAARIAVMRQAPASTSLRDITAQAMRAVLLAKVTVAICADLLVRSCAAQGCRPVSFRTMRITSDGTPDLTACVAGMLRDDIPRRSVRRSAHEALDAILIADAVDLAVSKSRFRSSPPTSR